MATMLLPLLPPLPPLLLLPLLGGNPLPPPLLLRRMQLLPAETIGGLWGGAGLWGKRTGAGRR